MALFFSRRLSRPLSHLHRSERILSDPLLKSDASSPRRFRTLAVSCPGQKRLVSIFEAHGKQSAFTAFQLSSSGACGFSLTGYPSDFPEVPYCCFLRLSKAPDPDARRSRLCVAPRLALPTFSHAASTRVSVPSIPLWCFLCGLGEFLGEFPKFLRAPPNMALIRREPSAISKAHPGLEGSAPVFQVPPRCVRDSSWPR